MRSSTRREAEVAGLRAVAILEALKGVIVLAAGFGLMRLVHRDVAYAAHALIDRLHLNAARKFPHIFLQLAENLTDAQLWGLAALALAYALLRFAEAYGLWRGRGWGQWIAAVSGAIYVPAEIYELMRGVTWLKVSALILNATVVAYMCYLLWRRAPRSG
ncbi:MAG TPA: DUF2127 domain-containing protein [Burkholderiales bacterium]|nr:DUF2127 domain-containing protein [Burkholderiales bacterium]